MICAYKTRKPEFYHVDHFDQIVIQSWSNTNLAYIQGVYDKVAHFECE